MLEKNSRRIGIENLNIRGMVRNQCLARSIADAGFFEFRPVWPQASVRQPRWSGSAFKSNILHLNPTAGRAGASLPSSTASKRHIARPGQFWAALFCPNEPERGGGHCAPGGFIGRKTSCASKSHTQNHKPTIILCLISIGYKSTLRCRASGIWMRRAFRL